MKRIALATCILSVAAATLGGAVTSFYDLEMKTLAGKPADLSQYRGTVSLVVNVASAAINEVHWLDAVLFEQTEFVKDYFDASLFPPSDYLWSGTAHASISSMYPRRTLKDERLQTTLTDFVPAGVQFQTHYGETAPASSI